MQKNIVLLLFFLAGLPLFFSGCGLDQVYYLDGPSYTFHDPSVTSNQTNKSAFTEAYFKFRTNNNQDSDGDFDYQGTAIYYKIYNYSSTLLSNVSSISSLSSSTNASSAAQKVISLGYQPLGLDNRSKWNDPLIPATSSNQKVYIRLTNYQHNPDKGISNPAYKAVVKIKNDSDSNDDDDSTWTELGVPRRYDNQLTFDFGRKSDTKSDYDVPPVYVDSSNYDKDFSYSSSWNDDDKQLYFIDMYAFAVGRDNSFTKYYSNVLHIGSVAINAGDIDN